MLTARTYTLLRSPLTRFLVPFLRRVAVGAVHAGFFSLGHNVPLRIVFVIRGELPGSVRQSHHVPLVVVVVVIIIRPFLLINDTSDPPSQVKPPAVVCRELLFRKKIWYAPMTGESENRC